MLKCKDCGKKFNSEKNEETVEKEIFVEGKEGYEKKTEKRNIPKCPNCGSNDYEPISVPAGDPLTREIAIKESR